MFKPIDKMKDRVEVAREESDVVLFYDLMKLGELVVKVTTAGLIAAIVDDRERNRYSLIHRLVRANGIGDWGMSVEAAMKPPFVDLLVPAASDERNQLTQRCKAGSWQYDTLTLLNECFDDLGISKQTSQSTGLQWLKDFTHLRNKTPVGHGAQLSNHLSKACPSLEQSINLFIENFRLFERSWAYVSRNQSGKYRKSKLSSHLNGFEDLEVSGKQATTYKDGVYVYFDQPMFVEMIVSDRDVRDFYFPNGNFNGNKRKPTFEVISYESGSTSEYDASSYMTPPVRLPLSETKGGELTVHESGECYTNMPQGRFDYIDRPELEEELRQKLTNSRQEVITLSGRGGIGKTSLTLSVLNKVARQGTFENIVWFSARDVDLLPSGPKQVTPDVLTAQDIAKQFLSFEQSTQKVNSDPLKSFCAALEKGVDNTPSLFVFDNFETVKGKREVYEIIDSVIRSPNKALITTRERSFTGDYAIEVGGMTDTEAQKLIDRTTIDLKIDSKLLTSEYRQQVCRESEGHPYVIKILLGEVAKSGRAKKPDRIMAGEEQILDALFERTYNETLSYDAQRVFLNLSNWRSVIPQLALEAVLLRNVDEENEERIRVSAAVQELQQCSFVEVRESPDPENERFISVPLTASLFGKRVLPTSPHRNAVQSDLELLRKFGPTQQTDIQHGIKPRVENLFRSVEKEGSALTKYLPILEVVARRYPPAWRHMVSLHERSYENREISSTKRVIEQYLQLPTDPSQEQDRVEAWKKLAILRRETGDFVGETNALIEMSRFPKCPIEDVSHTVRRFLNSLREERNVWSEKQRSDLIDELAACMENRRAELYPNDFGLLAWLYLNKPRQYSAAQDTEKAVRAVKQGLGKDSTNENLRNLAEKLSIW